MGAFNLTVSELAGQMEACMDWFIISL